MTPSPERRAEGAFLLPPLEGYPLTVEPTRAERLNAAYRMLGSDAGAAEAEEVARSLLESDPSFDPARVLEAQIDLLAERPAEALERLRPVVEEHPSYVAAVLLAARSAEKVGELIPAYELYRSVASRRPIAIRRFRELHDQVVQNLRLHVEEALARNRLEEAEEHLQTLREVADPDEVMLLEAERDVSVAWGDLEGELEAIRELVDIGGDDRALLERQAFLELEVGEPRRGIEILEELQSRYPDDPEIADRLAEAKFQRRLALLPEEVQELTSRPELSRAEFAKLIYWLIPQIRYSQVTEARIATDILDLEDATQEQIARVLNLDVMKMAEETLHRFAPRRPIHRADALESLLRAAVRFGDAVACVQDLGQIPDPTPSFVCTRADHCGLLSEAAECLPEATVSGGVAEEWIRKTLLLLGGEAGGE